ncbi:MAG: L-threonine 3-dehydrogenase [Candidatus Bipolaricaulota bacterium]
MHAIAKTKPETGAELVQWNPPTPGRGEVLIRVSAASICGTDVHIYTWDDWAQSRIRIPQILGHEHAGRVESVGPEVHHVKPGDYVTAETHIFCGRCFLCQTGNAHICRNVEILGVDRDGTFAEYLAVPESVVWHNDPQLPPKVATLMEPYGNSVHVVMKAEVAAKTVVIIGDGPTGLLAAGVAQAAGASAVWNVGLLDYRLQVAAELGAEATVNASRDDPVAMVRRWTEGLGADVVLEMSGSEVALKQALEMIRPGGRIIAFGIPSRPLTLNAADLVFKGVEILGVVGRRIFDTWHQAMRFLPQVDVARIITDELPLSRWQEGIDKLLNRQAIKVVLYPGE